jgi:lipopolysaccharide exporter
VEPEPGESPPREAGESTGIQRRAVRGFLWSALSYGGNKFFLFASTLILTRLLDPSDFGVVAAILAFMAYLEVLLDLGMSASIVYHQDEGTPEAVSVAFTLNAAACILLAGLNFVFAPSVAQFFRQPQDVYLFQLMSVYILIRSFGGIQDALLLRDLRFRERGAANLLRGIVRGVVSVALAYGGFHESALVWGFLAAEVVGTGTTWVQTRFRPRLRFTRPTAARLLRYGTPVAALGLLSELGENSDYFVVGHMLGSAALGLYTIAFRLPELLLSNVYWIFSSVAFPVLSRARAEGPGALRGAMLTSLRLLTMFAFPVGVGLALVSRDMILTLFSHTWAGSAGPMVLISLTIGVDCIGYASGDAFKAVGRPGTLLWIDTTYTVVMLLGFVVAAPHGITAVAAVHLSASVAYAVVRLATANHLVGTTMSDAFRAMRPAIYVAVAITAIALPLRLTLPPGSTALLLIVGGGIVGAGIGLLACGSATRHDLRRMALSLRR